MVEGAFITPPLFSVLCVALGAAVLTSPYLWFYRCGRNKAVLEQSFGVFVFGCMMSVLFSVALYSFLNGLVMHSGLLWPELCCMLLLALGAFVYFRVQGMVFQEIPVRVLRLWFLSNLQVAGLGAAVFVFGLSLILAVSFVFSYAAVGEVTFLVGVLLIGGLYMLHARLRRLYPDQRLKFHQILWPLALGIFLLMVPMLVQNFVNSEKFQQSLHAPPRLQRI